MSLPIPGSMFGRYLVEAFVARGGMGEIYRASDVTLRRPVALKVLSKGAISTGSVDPRFLREARLAAELSHPNIVVIYEVGEIDDTLYIAMEWVAGQTLRSVLDRSTPPLADRLSMMTAIADALAFAHERGVIHRDVKPSNVIVDGYGRPKLVDFGIAKRAQSAPAATFVTADGAIMGTPSYMAPEQMFTPDVPPAADQFAWGVLAYETITGRHPRDVAGPAYPLRVPRSLSWPSGLNPALAEVVERALIADPAARFPSMRALLAAWSSALAPAAVNAFGPTPPATYATVPDLSPMTAYTPAPAPKSGRAPLVALALLVLLVLVAAALGAIVFVFEFHREEAASTPIASASASIVVAPTALPSATLAATTSTPGTPGMDVNPPRPSAGPKVPTKVTDAGVPAVTKDASAPSPTPPSVVQPARFAMSGIDQRFFDDPEIDAARASTRSIDVCVAKHGGIVAGDQIWVRVAFTEKDPLHVFAALVGRKMEPALRSCVDAAVAKLPFRKRSVERVAGFGYDF